ncbi:MAG: DUF3833 domain-containing protein [Alphaproteobacteria bacterium]|jgi:hypothetical protein
MTRRRPSVLRRLLQGAIILVAGFAVLGGLSSCARTDLAALQDRTPKLELESFFAGETVAFGIFEDRFGNLRRQFRVALNGTVNGDELTLEEFFLYDDGEKDQRTWVIRKLGKGEDGLMRYAGNAADITGTAEGGIAGNAMNWQYDVVLSMSGQELEVHFDDWIYRQHEDVAINRAYVSKFGIEIGAVTIVFLRGDAAKALQPLDLENWS